jgi:hypothetical protein
MPDTPPIRPASAAEIAEALSIALRYDGRKREHHADDAMARITAYRLVRHLERSGFVLMKRPAGVAPTTARMPHLRDKVKRRESKCRIRSLMQRQPER